MSWPLLPLLTVHCLMVSKRTSVLVQLAVLTGVFGLALLVLGDLGEAALTFLVVGFVSAWMAFTSRASMWVLGVMWELGRARDVEARLAVAEERLRFGRDLHDVLGRNLAVIALKSELAVQLAHRGRPEAVEQMADVQRIAQDSQREVREVVRGYREADLRVEMEGARSVLSAAGIGCTVLLDEVELPDEARSALGWVVREATTNVLRHGDARRCTISVGAVDGHAVLVVENDRAGEGRPAPPRGPDPAAGAAGGPVPDPAGTEPGPAGGSGLAGLRERLAAVGGTLDAGPVRGGRFRVTARVPLACPEERAEGGRANSGVDGFADGADEGAGAAARGTGVRSPAGGHAEVPVGGAGRPASSEAVPRARGTRGGGTDDLITAGRGAGDPAAEDRGTADPMAADPGTADPVAGGTRTEKTRTEEAGTEEAGTGRRVGAETAAAGPAPGGARDGTPAAPGATAAPAPAPAPAPETDTAPDLAPGPAPVAVAPPRTSPGDPGRPEGA
jgi:signal transduction histidine kinase